MRWWVRDLQRAIILTAISRLDFVFRLGHVLIVTPLTEIVRPVAEVDGNAAAEEALPLDVLRAMLVAHGITDTVGFQLAVLAEEVLPRRRLLDAHVGSAVDHAPEVRFFASLTLIKAACVHGKPE